MTMENIYKTTCQHDILSTIDTVLLVIHFFVNSSIRLPNLNLQISIKKKKSILEFNSKSKIRVVGTTLHNITYYIMYIDDFLIYIIL